MPPQDKPPRSFKGAKRILGILTATLGGILILTPGAPVVFAVWSIPVTVPMIGYAVTQIGGLVFGYGVAAAKKETAPEKK